MLIRKYRDQFIAKLTDLYDKHEIESFFYILLEEYNQLKKFELALDPFIELNNEQFEMWEFALSQLLQFRPIQYITGKAYFYDGVFAVNPSTLIPRQETEELVHLIIEDHKNNTNLQILDIGTGSGCIAISLNINLKNSAVFAIDISEKAIEIATFNSISNKADVKFLQQNILETTELFQKFDIIVSNPPYVRELEKIEIKENVLNFEPHLALFVSDSNPLIFYSKIAELASFSLNKEGKLYFEINQYLGKETVEMIENLNSFSDIKLIKDIYGNDRIISAIKI